jgi:hypothetical protein
MPGSALSQLAWAHSKAVAIRPASSRPGVTHMSTPIDEGDLIMPRPRRPSETFTNVSGAPPTWSGVAFP